MDKNCIQESFECSNSRSSGTMVQSGTLEIASLEAFVAFVHYTVNNYFLLIYNNIIVLIFWRILITIITQTNHCLLYLF